MPISGPDNSGRNLQFWVTNSLSFLNGNLVDYALPLRQHGHDAKDLRMVKSAMSEFLDGRHLNDQSFCVCLEVLGALSAWFARTDAAKEAIHEECVSFMFESLMDGQVSVMAAERPTSELSFAAGL